MTGPRVVTAWIACALVLSSCSGSVAGTTPQKAGPATPPASKSAQGQDQPLSPDMQSALLLMQFGRFQEAAEAFKKALQHDKPTAMAYLGLAQSYERFGAFDDALQACDRAIDLAAPGREKANARNAKGLALYTRASQKQPPNADDLAAAEREFRAALELDPTYAIARFNLGVALIKAGNDPVGVGALREYLASGAKGEPAAEAAKFIENPRRVREQFAPEVTFVTLAGRRFDLASLKGRVVVLDFWASWCGPCHDTIPFLRVLEQRYADQRVTLISVSVDTDRAAWQSAVKQEKMTWTQVMDGDGRISNEFRVRPIPTAVVIDGEGIIRKWILGFSDSYGATLDASVRDALKRLAAPPAR